MGVFSNNIANQVIEDSLVSIVSMVLLATVSEDNPQRLYPKTENWILRRERRVVKMHGIVSEMNF